MSKTIPLRMGFNSVLLWSVISAAFIGPGTVTTCAKSGSQFGTSLIWALTFSTFATIVLQELVARLTMATGKNLGELIAEKYQSKSTKWISILLFFAVSFGCAAYETGNIIGAIAGLKLMYPLHSGMYAILIVAACFTILHKGTIAQVAQIMGVLVFIMGIVFFYLMWTVNLNWWQLIKDGIVPSIPPSSGTLLIGLVGTTIVPYNLFLASGMKISQSLSEMRWGIIIAVLLGGMIRQNTPMSTNAIRFNNSNRQFYMTVKKRVDDYFRQNNISKYGNYKMVIKSIAMFAFYLTPYFLLVTNTFSNCYLLIGLCIAMGIGMSGIGLSVMHDAVHGSYSQKQGINKLMSLSMAFIGGSSLNWHLQHNNLHYTFTNIEGHDEDIAPLGFLRFAPHAEYRKIHKFQFIYAWVYTISGESLRFCSRKYPSLPYGIQASLCSSSNKERS